MHRKIASSLQSASKSIEQLWTDSPTPPVFLPTPNPTFSAGHSKRRKSESASSDLANEPVGSDLNDPGVTGDPISSSVGPMASPGGSRVQNKIEDLLTSLAVRGKGSYVCPYEANCDKGGIRPSGEIVTFERNSTFRQVPYFLSQFEMPD